MPMMPMSAGVARHKPIKITERPSDAEITQHWADCYSAPLPSRSNHRALQQRVYLAFNKAANMRNSRDSHYDFLYQGLLGGGYLQLVDPPMATEAGAEEYDEIMKGQKIWVSTRTNSGN